jgi:hypothetical protein
MRARAGRLSLLISLLAETLLTVETSGCDSSTDTDTDSNTESDKYEEGTQITGFTQRVMHEVFFFFRPSIMI